MLLYADSQKLVKHACRRYINLSLNGYFFTVNRRSSNVILNFQISTAVMRRNTKELLEWTVVISLHPRMPTCPPQSLTSFPPLLPVLFHNQSQQLTGLSCSWMSVSNSAYQKCLGFSFLLTNVIMVQRIESQWVYLSIFITDCKV